MNTPATRFLQQEVIRLQKEQEAQQARISSMQGCVDTLAQLYWNAQRIRDERDLGALLDRCLRNVIEVVGAEDGSIAYLDEAEDELVFIIVRGSLQDQLVGHRIAHDTGVAGWVLNNDEPVTVNNTRQDWRFSGEVDEEFAFLTQSLLCTPIRQQGDPVGVIELINKAGGFDQTDATLLAVLSDVAALVLAEILERGESPFPEPRPPATFDIEELTSTPS